MMQQQQQQEEQEEEEWVLQLSIRSGQEYDMIHGPPGGQGGLLRENINGGEDGIRPTSSRERRQ